MPRGIMLVTTAPASPEVEDAYNAWYDDVHLAEVCSVPGFVAAERYAPLDGGPYVAIYHLEADDLHDALAELRKAAAEGRVNRSPYISTDPAPETRVMVLRSAH